MDDHDRRLAHARSLLELGRGAEAEPSLRAALAAEPGAADVTHLLARALLLQGRVAEATPLAREAVRLDPWEAEHLILMATVLLEAGHVHEAYGVAMRAVELAPDEWVTHLVVAAAALDLRSDEGLRTAERAAHRAVTLAPHEADAHNMYGVARWRAADVATATTAFDHALALDPTHAEALGNVAQLELDRGELVGGSSTLGRALALHPQHADLHDGLHRAHQQALRTATAYTVLTCLIIAGFMLATDFLWRQRAGQGAFLLLFTAALFAKVVHGMPGSKRSLLPWLARPGARLTVWSAWSANVLAGLVWLAPASVAVPGWFVLAAVAAVLTVRFVLRVLVADSEAAQGRSGA